MFYSLNEFDVDIHRCDFGYFIDFMTMIGAHNRRHIRSVSLTMKDRPSCGNGLLDFVRWCAKVKNADELELDTDVRDWNEEHLCLMEDEWVEDVEDGEEALMLETKMAVSGAMALGTRLRDSGKTSEKRIRSAFYKWLDEEKFLCSYYESGAEQECLSMVFAVGSAGLWRSMHCFREIVALDDPRIARYRSSRSRKKELLECLRRTC